MDPVEAAIEIDVPRDVAFAALADLSRRPSFTDHFLNGYRLTRLDPQGVGAGARFQVSMPLRSVWMDTTIVELEGSHRIVERGRGGRLNRTPVTIVWELTSGAGSLTSVSIATWTEPTTPLDKALEKLSGAAMWQQRGWREALRRLRDQLEGEAAAAAAIGVAGGNPVATGIP